MAAEAGSGDHTDMIWFLFALMLGTMLVGVPILLSIALVGYVGVAATELVLPLFAHGNQVRIPKNLEVFRHGRLTRAQLVDDVGDARAALPVGGSV